MNENGDQESVVDEDKEEDQEESKVDDESNEENATENKLLKRKADKPLSKQEKKKRKLESNWKQKEERKEEYTAESKAKAATVSIDRILTDKDFAKIDMAMAKKQVTFAKKGVKRALEEDPNRGELVKLDAIENIPDKKLKHDKQARIESVKVNKHNNFIQCEGFATSPLSFVFFTFLRKDKRTEANSATKMAARTSFVPRQIVKRGRRKRSKLLNTR